MAQTLDAILAQWRQGSLSAPLAVMEMLLTSKDPAHVEAWLIGARGREPGETPGEEGAGDLLRLLRENRDGCARVAHMAAADGPCGTVAEVSAFFDRHAVTSEEASVALYSLGSTAILEDATREVTTWLRESRLLDGARDVLDVGCGIGRFEVALARQVRGIIGVDVSANMVQVARRRTACFDNVRIEVGDGHRLPIRDETIDLALLIDSMPYLVGLGPAVVEKNVREIVRGLRGGGDLIILQFSYRNDLARDRGEVASLAHRHGLLVLENGSAPFSLWNGRAFHLRRPVGHARLSRSGGGGALKAAAHGGDVVAQDVKLIGE